MVRGDSLASFHVWKALLYLMPCERKRGGSSLDSGSFSLDRVSAGMAILF